jgi:hypothetical protein
MRALLLAALLIPLAFPAEAQRTAGPHDGLYEGTRIQECRRTGRSGQARITAELRGSSFSIQSLPGDPPLQATVSPTGAVTLPPFGLFGAGTGQIFEGRNDARRFTGSHPGRGDCAMVYDLRRVPGRRR